MLDRGLKCCLVTLACLATLAVAGDTLAGGCYGDGYGYRYGGGAAIGYGYRYPRAYPSGCGYALPLGYWDRCAVGPRRYVYSRAYYPRYARVPYCDDYRRYGNAVPSSYTPSYDIRPSYRTYGAVEVYEGGAPANDAAREAAWDQLRAGSAADAQRTFARWGRAKPEASEPQLGYALASAMRRDHASATTAMRRALDAAGAALRDLRGDDTMRARVQELIDVYAYRSTNRAVRSESMFMTAALYYMIADDDMANEAMAAVRSTDERDTAVAALRGLIDVELGDTPDRAVIAVK